MTSLAMRFRLRSQIVPRSLLQCVSACRIVTLIGMAGFLSLSAVASGGFVVATDRATFLGATTSSTAIDFASAYTPNPSLVTDYSGPSGLNLNGVQFVGSNYLYVVHPDNAPQFQGWTGNPITLEFGGGSGSTLPGYVDITLPVGTTAIGTDLYAVLDSSSDQFGGDVRFTLFGGAEIIAQTPLDRPNPGFIGILSDTPITSLRIEAVSSYYPELSNFIVGTAAPLTPVPEPTSLVLMALGGTMLYMRRLATTASV